MELLSSTFLLNLIKLIIAMLCGYLIGLVQNRYFNPAGLLLPVFTSVGASLFVMIPLTLSYFPGVEFYYLALPVAVATGIVGFAIILRSAGRLRGFTAAASLWLCAAVGLAVGAGLFLEGISVTVILYFFFTWIRKAGEDAEEEESINR